MTALLVMKEASETWHTDDHWEVMHVESAEQPARRVENKDDGEATRTGSHRFDVVEWQGVFMRTFKRDPAAPSSVGQAPISCREYSRRRDTGLARTTRRYSLDLR